jgi:hypothetical protein
MKHREQVIKDLKPFFMDLNQVIAVWEAGSKATGFVDEYSDIDLYITVTEDGVEATFDSLNQFLDKKYGIVRKFRVPEPSWHGASQTFYQLSYGPSYFYLDVAVFKLSNPNKFMEKDRHGVADVWFEKQQVYDDTPTPQEVVLKKNKAFYQGIVASEFITMLEVEKAIHRNNYLDAYPFYYSFIARNVVGLLNIIYRPEKYDFGMRYIARTYSSEDQELIKNAFGVKTIDEIKHHYELLKNRYQQAKQQLHHLAQ